MGQGSRVGVGVAVPGESLTNGASVEGTGVALGVAVAGGIGVFTFLTVLVGTTKGASVGIGVSVGGWGESVAKAWGKSVTAGDSATNVTCVGMDALAAALCNWRACADQKENPNRARMPKPAVPNTIPKRFFLASLGDGVGCCFLIADCLWTGVNY